MPAEPTFDWVDIDLLVNNPWNPNVMDTGMFDKAVESIHRFGFVDPVTAREIGLDKYQIVDGEHRVRAAKEHSSACKGDDHVGMTQLPITNLGMIEDHVAKQLTIVLNETRGEPDPKKLGLVLVELLAAEPMPMLLELLPFTKPEFEELAQLPSVDWNQLTPAPKKSRDERWVERVYRLPDEVAKLFDKAIEHAKEFGGAPDASVPEAIRRIAEEYLSE